METSGNKKSKKGRNKWINKLILRASHNQEGASLNPEEKKVVNSKGPRFTQPESRPIILLRRPVEPEPATTPQEAEPAPELMAEPELTLTAEQQPASLLQGPSVEAYCEQTNQALLMIPELELQRITGEKEEQISKLAKEKQALLKEVKRLKLMLEKETKEANLQHGFLKAELSKQGKTNKEASHKIGQLEKALEAEKEHNKEMDVVLAQQTDKMFRIEVNLAEANVDLHCKRNQWEEDRSRLLAEQRDETSILMAALKQAKEDLENERHQWKEEKSLLLDSLHNNKKTLEEKEGARGGSMETMSDLERQNDEIEAQEPKKTKKRSLRKRFLQLFK